MSYYELKTKQQEEFDNFSNKYILCAFTKEDFNKELSKHNLKEEDVVRIISGSYISKENVDKLNNLLIKQQKEKYDYTINHVKEVVKHELANYEAEISMSYTYAEIISQIIGLTEEDQTKYRKEIKEAVEEYKEDFYKNF